MLIQCPKCRTKYKVSDEVLRGAAPVFRCSRCKHTFDYDANEARDHRAGETAPVGLETAPAEPELSLSFAEPREHIQESERQKPDEQRTDVSKGQKPAESSPLEQTEGWSLNLEERQHEVPFTMSDTATVADHERSKEWSGESPAGARRAPTRGEPDKPEIPHNILAISPYLEQRASVQPFVTLLVLLVILFSLLGLLSHAHPNASDTVLRKIPLIGASILKNRHLKNGILIHSFQASYQTIQGNREVFLITGMATNQNPVVVREIQLSGKVYNQQGKELEEQTIWVGNTLSPKIVRGMTTEDIPHLQNLKPLKSFEIPPGESVPFTIVFLKSTKTAKAFTCEVIGAEGEA